MPKTELNDLYIRRAVCKLCITTIDNMPKDTEGRMSAMEHYKNQLAKIDDKITNITGTPPPVVVGLKTAKLFGNSGLNKED